MRFRVVLGWLLLLPTIIFASAASATASALSPPMPTPQTPVAGAPTVSCEFENINADTPLRITIGDGAIPYQFACGHNRPPGVCVIGALSPGLIVNLGRVEHGFACVTGGDSTSGWISVEHLRPVPRNPHVPASEWLGWWCRTQNAKGVKENRILITRKAGSGALHVSGRAYWYGMNDNVHFGAVQADAIPIGQYLHAVQSFEGGACVIDMMFELPGHTLMIHDNMGCGGMNVRFNGSWRRFTPK